MKNLVAIDGTLDAVEDLHLRILEKGRRARRDEIFISRRDAVREFFECSNPLCQGGGFSLGDLLRDIIRSRQTEFIGTSFCAGLEGDLDRADSLRSCQTRFEVVASLRYR